MKVGDVIRVKRLQEPRLNNCWPESIGQIGVIVAEARRLFVPARKVLVLGEIAEFDLDELEYVSES